MNYVQCHIGGEILAIPFVVWTTRVEQRTLAHSFGTATERDVAMAFDTAPFANFVAYFYGVCSRGTTSRERSTHNREYDYEASAEKRPHDGYY